jgi:RND family efflux transporter MFP subunit
MNDKHHESLAIHGGEHTKGLDLPPRQQVWTRARIAVAVVALLLAAGAARTIMANYQNAHRLADITAINARQYVNVVQPVPARNDGQLVLPGTLRGYVQSPIYARASGYVLRWHADIGAHVKQGQLLAELDTPEIDQELAQTVAQRQQSASTLKLAKTSLDRALQLRQRDAVAQQELDDRQGAYNQDVANLAAADANVQRLNQLESFKRVVAPFTGVVTQRNVDIGDLINAGNGGTGRALFMLSQSDPLRVYVQVPQAYSQQVSVGLHVSVTQAELPGRTFDGTVTHTSEAIDVPTRSLQIEVTLPNRDGTLMPGAYVEVGLPTTAIGRLVVPGNTLLFRAEGPRVAVVDADGKVHLKPVAIAHDLGQSLEIAGGLSAQDRVVLNPSDSLADGDPVIVAAAKTAPAASGTETKGASEPAGNAATNGTAKTAGSAAGSAAGTAAASAASSAAAKAPGGSAT